MASRRPRHRLAPAGCLLALLAAGCAHPAAPAPAGPAGAEAAAAARRSERLRLMREYWEDRTGAGPGAGPAPAAAPPLEYPAGNYAGLNFAPRIAPDPSLAEPPRS